MSASSWFYLEDCTIKAVTEKAMLVECEQLDEPTWIPLSQVEEPDKFEVGDTDLTVGVTNWWAKKNNLETE